jgi:putative chitinase
LNNPEGLANFVYAGNIGNGNEATGDGWTFRGRGSMQLTGRANYEGYQNYLASIGLGWWYTSPANLSDPNGIQSVLSAMWYFKSRVLDKMTIDAGTTVKKVTREINSGKKGLAKRKNYFNKAKVKLNC